MNRAMVALAVLLVLLVGTGSAQTRITTPKEQLGFSFGDDYQLANYRQIAEYWRKLDAESDRLVLHEMGKTAEGRVQLMAVVTSPENHRNLTRYRDIARRLALAEGLDDEQARALARAGKAIVWIDGGLHATETLGAQQLAEMVYQMVSRTDEETERFLNDVIVLFVHANPDGNDLVADWYMRNPAPETRSLSGVPRLYQKYIGHDNNRDFFASTQAETENVNRALYHDWFPQILYNHHQSGPAGTVLWSSPQRNPYNFNLDPLLILGLEALGTAMHQRLAAEGKPGATKSEGGPYDGWWNGGIRNTGNFHNVIAILTETIGSPTPMRIPLVMDRQLPARDMPYPIAPQPWRFRQSVEYSITNNRAVIDYASRNREHLLFNIYRMGKNSIEKGTRDHWTPSPARHQAVAEKIRAEAGPAIGRGGPQVSPAREAALWAELRRPELRDPRAYVIPADQADFPTAVKFVNALREVNVTVHRATADFSLPEPALGPGARRSYPAGSFVVFTAQAFRPHVIDMFEPQDHPNVIPYPGAPPTPPYDNAGWTLAFQMGVEFDRILEPFQGPFEKIEDWNVKPPAGRVTTMTNAAGYVTGRGVNDAVAAANRLLAAGEEVFWLMSPTDAAKAGHPAGTLYVTARRTTVPLLQKISAELGVTFEATAARPGTDALRLQAPRIGLWDQYGGSMPSGWTRWILEQFGFAHERTFPAALDAGDLRARYDALVFVQGAIPASDDAPAGGFGRVELPQADEVPEEYRGHLGRVTVARTIPEIRRFVESGGTVIAIGSSAANLARHLGLPVENHLVENGTPLPRSKYFVPGSVLTARVDASIPAAHGMRDRADFFFDNSPVFRLAADAEPRGARAIAWFDGPRPLHSGWAWGQQYLDKGVVAVEARMGSGRVLLFGPEILQRAQPHGTFKLLFNGLYLSAATPAATTKTKKTMGSR
jgi:hypothetical protein